MCDFSIERIAFSKRANCVCIANRVFLWQSDKQLCLHSGVPDGTALCEYFVNDDRAACNLANAVEDYFACDVLNGKPFLCQIRIPGYPDPNASVVNLRYTSSIDPSRTVSELIKPKVGNIHGVPSKLQPFNETVDGKGAGATIDVEQRRLQMRPLLSSSEEESELYIKLSRLRRQISFA